MESKPRRRGLEVFDFVDEDEFPDPVTKFPSACRNPSLSDSRNSKAVLVKPGSKEANAQEKKVSCMPCVDVNGADTDFCRNDISHSPPNTIEKKLATKIDFLKLDSVTQSKCLSLEQRSLDSDSCIPCLDGDAMEDDHGCDNAILHSGLESMEDKLAIKEEYLELDAATQSKCFIHEQQSDYDLNDNGCRNFLSEPERGGSNAPSSSPGKSQNDCAVNVSPSSNKPADAVSDGDESVSESPSSPTSQIEEDDVSMDAYEFDHLGNFEVDNMNMTVILYPDYVLYRDSYCTGDLQLTFSQSCIQISGSTLSESDEALNFEFGVDDVDSVECQWYPNVDCVIIKLRILSKDAARDDDALGSLGIEELKIGVVETNWSHQLEKIACLNFKYSAILNPLSVMEEEESLEQRLHFPKFDDAFEVVYPKGNPDAVSISNRDVDLLQPDIFINDTLIDFYIKYLENHIQPEEKHRFYFFNSFFFRKLADMDKDPSSVVSDGRAAFQRVRKWTRKVDLFEKDYIFIPVNFNLHWTLLVICHPGEVPRYKDGDSGNPVKVPCILHMDSLKGSHSGIKNHVQSYLWEEWKEKKKETSEELSSKFFNLRFISLELPQQENSYDCGLFLLHYLELFLAEAPVNFNPFEINKLSIFLNENWFLPSEASLKRTFIQRLIFELLESRGVPLPACSDQDQAIYPGCNELETGVQCTDRHSPAVVCLENISSSQADQGIEMTLLPTSSLRGSECVNDAGLVLREFFQSGETAGSLFGQYQSFEQKSPFYHPGGATHLIEEATQIGEQYTYMAAGDIVIQEITAFSSQACGIPCLSKSSGVETSFELCNSEQEPNGKIESSHERAVCTSDGSDCIEFIEDDTVREDLGPSQKQEMDEQNYPISENATRLADELFPDLGEMPRASMIEERSKDHETVHEGNENGDLSQREEMDVQNFPASENVNCLADELFPGPGEMQSAAVIEESSQDHETVLHGNDNGDPSQKEEMDVQKYPASENVNCVADEPFPGPGEMESAAVIEESSQDHETVLHGNDNGDPSQKEETDVQNYAASGNVNCLANEPFPGLGEMQSTFVIEESSQYHETVLHGNDNGDPSQKEEMDVQNYAASGNVNCLANELVSGLGEMQSAAVIEESSQDKQTGHDGNENEDLSQKEEMDLQKHPASENVTSLADEPGSGLVEMQSAAMIEESSQDLGTVHDDNENEDLSQKEEMDLQNYQASLIVTCLADKLGSGLVEMQSATVIEESSQDNGMVHDDNENGDSSQKEEMDLQNFRASENVNSLADEFVSGRGEMQSAVVIEESSQDHGTVHDDNENGDSSQKEEMDLQNYSENVTCLADKLGSGLVEMQSAAVIEESSQDNGMVHDGNENGDSSQKKAIDETIDLSTENAVCLASGLISGSGKVQSTCVVEESSQHKRKLHGGNEIGGSVPSSQENSGIPMHQDSVTVGNGTIPSDDMQMFDHGLLPEAQDPESEEQRAAKRMRITPPIEVEKCVT